MRLFFALLLAFSLWSSALAVEAGIQITDITGAAAIEILAAPQANRTRLVPIGGLVSHNDNVTDAEVVDIEFDDDGTVKVLYTILTGFLAGVSHFSECVIVLGPNQKLLGHIRTAAEVGVNFHVSFLEHRPTT